MSLKSDLTFGIKGLRFTDLGKLERALNDAYSSIQRVEDAGTAEEFAGNFEDIKREAKNLADSANDLSGKVTKLQAEMKEQEEAGAEK